MVMINYNRKFPFVRKMKDETSVKLSQSNVCYQKEGILGSLYQTMVHALKVMNLTNLYRVMVLDTL